METEIQKGVFHLFLHVCIIRNVFWVPFIYGWHWFRVSKEILIVFNLRMGSIIKVITNSFPPCMDCDVIDLPVQKGIGLAYGTLASSMRAIVKSVCTVKLSLLVLVVPDIHGKRRRPACQRWDAHAPICQPTATTVNVAI